MKLKVKYIFPTLSSGTNFCCQLSKSLGKKKSAHSIRMQRNPQTRENIFWIFTDFHSKVLLGKKKLPPQSSTSLEAVEPHPQKEAVKFFFKKIMWVESSTCVPTQKFHQ